MLEGWSLLSGFTSNHKIDVNVGGLLLSGGRYYRDFTVVAIQRSVEWPAIARVIGTLNYFERFTGTIVLQLFVLGPLLGIQQFSCFLLAYNISNYYFYTLIYNKEVHTFCLSIGLWIPVEYY